MRLVPNLLATLVVMASGSGASWAQTRTTTAVVVHGSSLADELTVYTNEPTVLKFDSPIQWATSTHTDWFKLELDSATGLLTVTFIGKDTPSDVATIQVITAECLYVLRVKATDDETKSDPLRHFQHPRPPGLTTNRTATPSFATMPLGAPRPPIMNAYDAARAAAELSRAPYDNPADTGANRRTDAVSYHVKAMAGVLWAGNSVTGDQRAAAPLTGLGLEVRKGYTPSLAVDGELLVAGSGEAVFQDADTTDQLVQTTRLARLGVAARLRLGDRRIPFVRVGLGFEGSWSQLHTPAAWLPPEFAWGLQLSLALGFDLALGDHALAGAALSATGRRSIASTLHVGYAP